MTDQPTASLYPRIAADELNAAALHFREGNIGKARVCARRAVGFGITERFKHDPRYRGLNAMNAIRIFRAEPDLPADVIRCLDEMVTRVDDQFNLPEHIDLLLAAKVILDHLFQEENSA